MEPEQDEGQEEQEVGQGVVMPFKSQAQRRFLYATNPKVAKKFSAHTPKNKKLPEKVKMDNMEKMAAKKTLVSRLLKRRQPTKKQRVGKFLEDFAKSRSQSRMSTDVLAHELGHAKAFGKSGPLGKSVRSGLYAKGSDISMALNATALGSAKAGKFSGKRALIQAAGEAPKLLEEAAATYYGLKAMKGLKYISPKQYKKAKSNLFRAYGSYGLNSAGKVIGAGAGPMTRAGGSAAPKMHDAGALYLGGLIGGTLGQKLLVGFKPSHNIFAGAKGGASTKRQAKALAKKMGVNPLIVSSKKTRIGNNAFSMNAQDVNGMSGLLMLKRKAIGKRGMRKALRDGVVSAPTMRLSEVAAQGGKKGLKEKALSRLEDIAKNMQKR